MRKKVASEKDWIPDKMRVIISVPSRVLLTNVTAYLLCVIGLLESSEGMSKRPG